MTLRSFVGGSLQRMEDEEDPGVEPGKVREGLEEAGSTLLVDVSTLVLEASVGRSECPVLVPCSSADFWGIWTDILCSCRRLSALRDVPSPRASKYLIRAANSGGGP